MSRAKFAGFASAALLAASCALHRGSEPECCASGDASAACCCSSTDESKGDAKSAAANHGAAANARPDGAGAAADAADKAADLERQVELAKRKAERAHMDLEQQQRDGETALQKARVDLELAKQELAQFQNVEKPLRVAEAQLNLQRTADAMSEQQEEMQQLELMYQKDDLGDKTKEIVLVRGKRRLERAKTQLELAHKRFEELEATQLAQQQTKLELAVRGKEADLQRAEFAARTGMLDKETAVLAAQYEVDKLHREQAKAKEAAEKVSLAADDRKALAELGYVYVKSEDDPPKSSK